MIFYVEKNKILNFCSRASVYIFLKEYSEYEFVEIDDETSNVFVAKYNKEKMVVVSLFSNSRKIINKFKKYKDISEVHIYRLTNKKYKDSDLKKNKVFHDDFILKVDRKNDEVLLTSITSFSDFDLAKKIFKPYLQMNYNYNGIYYKYKGSNGHYVQEMIDGEITYCNPITFNDPFDCDFVDASSIESDMVNVKDKFRVLCLSPKYNDILMWGYYGNSHNGVCVGQTLKDIIDATIKVYNGLIIYGKIRYQKKRPNYICKPKDAISKIPYFNSFNQLTKCCFTKFSAWKHEEEFRIVTFLKNYDLNNISFHENNESNSIAKDYIPVKGKTSVVYKGCKFRGPTSIVFPSKITKSLIMDKGKYELK